MGTPLSVSIISNVRLLFELCHVRLTKEIWNAYFHTSQAATWHSSTLKEAQVLKPCGETFLWLRIKAMRAKTVHVNNLSSVLCKSYLGHPLIAHTTHKSFFELLYSHFLHRIVGQICLQRCREIGTPLSPSPPIFPAAHGASPATAPAGLGTAVEGLVEQPHAPTRGGRHWEGFQGFGCTAAPCQSVHQSPFVCGLRREGERERGREGEREGGREGEKLCRFAIVDCI